MASHALVADRRAPTGSEVDIAVIASDGGKGLQPRAKAVDRSHIDGVVTFADVKRAAISHDSFDDLGDHDVGIRVAVAVRIGAEIVGNQEAADGEVLGDRLAMVSGHARAKYCGALIPPEADSTGRPGMETGAPGRPGLASRISS